MDRTEALTAAIEAARAFFDSPKEIQDEVFLRRPDLLERFQRLVAPDRPSPVLLGFDSYQEIAWSTMAHDLSPEIELATLALGLSGEAGEVADLIKKHIGHGHPLDVLKVLDELGDIQWYVSGMAKHFGTKLTTVAAGNVMKLRKRYPDGFSTERSINRPKANPTGMEMA